MMITKRRWILVLSILLVSTLLTGCLEAPVQESQTSEQENADVVTESAEAGVETDGVKAEEEDAKLKEAVTPYQRQLEQTLDERTAAGLPIPSSVTFEYELAPPQEVAKADGDGTEHVVEITAKTTLHFDGPEQAGYDVWPALVVTGTLPTDAYGSVLAGDYSELYRTLLAEQIPGIWDQVEFGQEPRTQTISETFNVAYEGEQPNDESVGELVPLSTPLDANDAASVESILMGLTYMGPAIDYTFGDSLMVRDFTVYDFVAGFRLDWTAGLRLPADVALGEQAAAGSSERFATVLFPQDWSKQDYIDAGVAAEEGNEFVLRFDTFLGIKAILLEINVCPGCHVETSVNESASFAMPFGPDAYLPIPQINVPIRNWSLGFASTDIGINVMPKIGSSRITADWRYWPGSECEESGQIAYTAQEEPIVFGPDAACAAGVDEISDGSTNAVESEMQLTDFRYWFDQLSVGFSIEHETEVFGNDLLSGESFSIQMNLNPLAGFLWLGAHEECTWDFKCQLTEGYDSVTLSPATE